MPDHAVSDSPAVQAQLNRLATLSPGTDILGLERIRALLGRIGNPEQRLPPMLHVAGTNGKGSTCAFLRAALEAAGHTVHAYTSPHLVRFNERIRLAGRLIADDALAEVLREVLDAAEDMIVSFFEATTAAAFLAFSRTRADALVLEVGLGGRLDATNVIERPAVCGITQLGLDHQFFLGDTIEQIAREKAGIAKAGTNVVTLAYPPNVDVVLGEAIGAVGATWLRRGESWDAEIDGRQLRYRDEAGALDLPFPRLQGEHQALNAALAVALLRHQTALAVPEAALAMGIETATWPARLQQLAPGPIRDLLPPQAELWLDGAHNPAAASAIAGFFKRRLGARRPLHIIFGLLANKDAAGVLDAWKGMDAVFHTIPVPSHAHHSPQGLAELARTLRLRAEPATSVQDALAGIAAESRGGAPLVLILGSLYLAGAVLKQNGQEPE